MIEAGHAELPGELDACSMPTGRRRLPGAG
jgi:hypothetical protein